MQPCKYGATCYRKNPDHLKNFYHPPPAAAASSSPPPPPPAAAAALPPASDDNNDDDGMRKRAAAVDDETSCAKQPRGDAVDLPSDDDDDDRDLPNTTDFACTFAADATQPESRDGWKQQLHKIYGVHFPDDFFHLWELCSILHPSDATRALEKDLDLVLTGPYDVLAKKFNSVRLCDMKSFHLHWRFPFDPPEMLTVLRQKSGNKHWGYFRDDPSDQEPIVIMGMDTTPELQEVGDDIFSVLLQALKKNAAFQKQIDEILTTKTSKGKKMVLKTAKIDIRKGQVVASTVHKLGMIVPVNKKTDTGYRPLPCSVQELRKLVKTIEADEAHASSAKAKLQDYLNYVQMGMDECDFGQGLEMGLDLFSLSLSKTIVTKSCEILRIAYALLNRDVFATIIKVHSNPKHRNMTQKTSFSQI